MNVYTIADSLTDTIQFDVIATATNQQVKNGSVVSRPSFDFIKMPSGIGFKQKLETVNGETIDYVISQAMEKKQIKLQLAWKGKDGYAKFQSFSTWIANYFNVETYHIRFSYKIGAMRRFVEVAVVDLELEGRQGNFVSAQITLQPLTPFYEEYDGSFTLVMDTNTGKIYNYTYPYIYGGGAFSGDNAIINDYLKPLPLKITLKGPMDTPYVSIARINEDDTVESNPYLRVQFASGFSIDDDEEVVIDAFNNKVYLNKYELDDDGNRIRLISTTDVFNYIDKTYDSFLFANPGRSRIAASLDTSSSECRVTYVRYVV